MTEILIATSIPLRSEVSVILDGCEVRYFTVNPSLYGYLSLSLPVSLGQINLQRKFRHRCPVLETSPLIQTTTELYSFFSNLHLQLTIKNNQDRNLNKIIDEPSGNLG